MYSRDAFLVAQSGWRPDTPFTQITLTAPGCGPQHHVAFDDGRRCTPRRRCPGCGRRVAPCGLRHRPGDACVGAPVCDCFDYVFAARWNANASKLLTATLKELNAGRASRGEPRLSYLACREWQRRGLVHVHVIVRGVVDAADLEAVVAEVDFDGCRWGNIDVKLLPAGDGSAAERAFRYLAKYCTKQGADLMFRGRGPTAEHLARLRSVAAFLARSPDCQCWDIDPFEPPPGYECRNCRRAASGLGYRGHVLTKSHDWGVSFKQLRLARRQWRAGRDASPTAGRWRAAGWGYLREHDDWAYAATRRRGDLPPPADRQLAALSARLAANGALPWPLVVLQPDRESASVTDLTFC